VIGPKSPALKRENTSDREFDTQENSEGHPCCVNISIPPSSRNTDDLQNLPVIGPKSPALKRENTSDREFDTQVCDADAHIVAGFSRDNEHAARPLDNPEGVRSRSWIVRRDFLVTVRRSVRL